jgi:hypothetical protein
MFRKCVPALSSQPKRSGLFVQAIPPPHPSTLCPFGSLPIHYSRACDFSPLRFDGLASPAASTFKVEEKPAAPEASSVSCRFRAQ